MYQVGFKSIFRFDPSRTWSKTRDYKGRFVPDRNGRPIQANVWYPASLGINQIQLVYSNYVEQSGPAGFSVLNSLMLQRNRQNAGSSVAQGDLAALLSIKVNAFAEATPASGKFPAVLYFGGLNADLNSNFVLCEFLASHGYVVASISLLGPSDKQLAHSRSASDLESIVRDMEFALTFLPLETNSDTTRLAAVGHSVGGIEAALLGLRNGNTLAVIGLDGTYGFRGSTGVLTNSFGYVPDKMRAAFLDIRREQGEQGADLDLSPILSFQYAERMFITIPDMHHSDFTSFAMIADHFRVPIKSNYADTGWNRQSGRNGYELACRLTLEFLNQTLKQESFDTNTLQRLAESVKGCSSVLAKAKDTPPSPEEFVSLVNQNGIDFAKAIFTRISDDRSVGEFVNAELFNAFGYELLGLHRPNDARAVFELVVWAHPALANAQDSLADAYLALGDKDRARAAIQKAIELAPFDATLDEASRALFIKDEQRRLSDVK